MATIHIPTINIPAEIEVPYGITGNVSVYIGNSSGVEADFTDSLQFYRFHKEKNIKGFCEFTLFGIENTDRDDYIKINNVVKVFVENKFYEKYIISDVSVDTQMEMTKIVGFSSAHKLSEVITDYSTFTYADTPSQQIISALASGIINIGENEDMGRITHTFTFQNMLDAATQLANYFGAVWWISTNHPFNTDYFNFKSHKGSIAPIKKFYSDGTNANIYGSELALDRDNFINSITITNSGNTINAAISAVSTIYSKLTQDSYYDVATTSLLVQLQDMSYFPSKGVLALGDERLPYDTIKGDGVFPSREITASGAKIHRKGLLAFLTYDGSSDQSTTVLSNVGTSDTTINATDTTGFTNTGSIIIAYEVISYTGKTATSFTGCTRVAGNPFAHDQGVVIFQYDSSHYYTKTNPQTGSSIQKWGLKEKKMMDESMNAESTEEMFATAFIDAALESLSNDKGGLASIIFRVSEPIQTAQDIDIDDTIYVNDIDNDVDHNLRVESMDLSETEDYGMQLIIEAANKRRGFIDTLINKLQGKYG